ncbi:MAG TPA: VOC family protein, partial [Opitutaceae bacterium]
MFARKMPATPRLNLIVLRARDADALARFYSALGLSFARHRHGNGPEHFAHEEGSVVFEIYSAAASGPTQSLRLGFAVDDLASTLATTLSSGATLVTPTAESP